MVVNFRARGISRGARKLARIPTLIIIIKKTYVPGAVWGQRWWWKCAGWPKLLSSLLLLFFVHFSSVLAFLCSVSSSSSFCFLLFSLSLFVLIPPLCFSSCLFFFILVSLSSWFLCVCVWLVRSTTCSEGKLKFLFS
jgi:hypothetical protein